MTVIIGIIPELSSLEPYYYSPENIEITYKGSYEPDITWHIDEQVYSSQNHVQLTPSVLSAWSGSIIVFSLALDMGQFPATMPPFTVQASILFTEGSETSLDTETATVYKRGKSLEIFYEYQYYPLIVLFNFINSCCKFYRF